MTGRTLGVMAKWPVPGHVKTRLAEATSPSFAAAVAAAFLEDFLDRLTPLPVRRTLAYAPDESRAFFDTLVGDRFLLHPQGEGDLGQRLWRFFDEQFRSGATSVVVLGTDSPTVPITYIEQAFQKLDRAEVVLGPATDGGYYLLGCNRPLPSLFDGIPWSSPEVLRFTVDRIVALGVRLALLPPWYDVDTREDWRMLRGHMAAMRRGQIDPGIPRTERLIEGSLADDRQRSDQLPI